MKGVGDETMNPYALVATAGLGGIGDYFTAQAQQEASQQQYQYEQEQLAEQQRQFNLVNQQQQSAKQGATNAVLSGYNTAAYDKTLNYQNPYQTGIGTAINTLLAGGLTSAEQNQQNLDISKAAQLINANASGGMPAGARLGLQGQNVQQISNNYANMASGRVAQGLSAANTAANTGLGITEANYNSGLSNWLQSQQLQNQKAGLLAQYAT
jgi:hypothetical protein